MPKGVYLRTKPSPLKGQKRPPFSEEWRLHMSDSFKGRKLTEHTKKKLSEIRKGHPPYYIAVGAENKTWKGDNVGYRALHSWVRRWLGTPDTCEHCGKVGLTGKKINWANKSHKYFRELNDWIRLCVSCHKKYDLKFAFKTV